MAYGVDFIPEQRLSRFPYRTELLQAPPPPAPTLPSAILPPFRPSFCQRCFSPVNPAFSLGGVCLSCAPRPPPPQPPSAPPQLPLSRHELLGEFGDPGVDGFMMRKMINVVDDVLKEHDERFLFPEGCPGAAESPPGGAKSTYCCKCGGEQQTYCIECQDFLCSSCAASHCIVPGNEDHIIVDPPLSISGPPSLGATPPGVPPTLPSPMGQLLPFDGDEELSDCESHPEEKRAYFCQECVSVLCKSCVMDGHTHHSCMSLRDAYLHFRPTSRDLLGKAQVEIDMLDLSFDAAKKMTESVSEKKEAAAEEVHQIFQAHREALAQREKEIIAQIDTVTTLRLESLAHEKDKIADTTKSLKELSAAAEEVLCGGGDKAEVLASNVRLLEKLQSCHNSAFGRNPVEDDSFVIKSDAGSAQTTLKTLCKLTTAPYPPLCTAVGEGLFHPRINRLCTVILCTKDRAGESCLEGGERLFVQMKSLSAGGLLHVDIRDNQDGSYSVNFRPRMKGDHQLVIAIRGQHIQGSPFVLAVDGGREYGRFGIVTQVFGSEGSHNGQFCRPWGICSDQQGNVVVGDRSNHRVQVFDSNGLFKHKFGGEGMRPGQFNRPAGVAVTREGHIVVADKDNHRIQVLKIDGTFLFMFGSKGGNDGQMIYPYDVAVNQVDGRIAVTDTGNHRLLIFSHEGILLGKFGYKGYLCGHFDSPRGIAFNDDGHIIVSDFNVHHILVIHPDGTTARILGSQGSGNGQFMRPQGIAVDHMGNFVVADTRNNRIVVMHPSGHFIAKFGTQGSAPGQFDRPTSIAVLPDGRIAVVDFGNSRIQIF